MELIVNQRMISMSCFDIGRKVGWTLQVPCHAQHASFNFVQCALCTVGEGALRSSTSLK